MPAVRDVRIAVCSGSAIVGTVVLRIGEQRQHQFQIATEFWAADRLHSLQAEQPPHALRAGGARFLRGPVRQAIQVLVCLLLVQVRQTAVLRLDHLALLRQLVEHAQLLVDESGQVGKAPVVEQQEDVGALRVALRWNAVLAGARGDAASGVDVPAPQAHGRATGVVSRARDEPRSALPPLSYRPSPPLSPGGARSPPAPLACVWRPPPVTLP